MNAAQSAHHEGPVHRGGESFADDITDIEANESVGQMKEVEEVSANVEEGSEAERDFDGVVAKGRDRNQRRLDKTRFANVLLADAAARESLVLQIGIGFREERYRVQGVGVL